MRMKVLFWKKICLGAIVLISALVIVTVFTSSAKGDDTYEILLNFSFDEPEITEVNISNTTYHQVTMNETEVFYSRGIPLLPIKTLRILLPQKGIVESINVTFEGNTSLGECYNVLLGNASYVNFSDIPQNESNEPNFNQSIPYPTKLYLSLGTSYRRGYSILLMNLYPLYYIGNTGEIYYYKNMSVNITANDTGSLNPFFRNLTRDATLMKGIVDDYSMNYTYTSMPPSSDNSTIIKKENKEYEFVIITRKEFVNEFQKLADFKNDSGITTSVVTVEKIKADPKYAWDDENWGDGDSFFDDTACRIRNFIKHAHTPTTNGGWSTDYVLLGGDNATISGNEIVELVPARNLWYKFFAKKWYQGALPSDIYYACLDGNFNADKSKYWGEPWDGSEIGDRHEPPQREDDDYYYAEADSKQYEEDFDVGLFTPSYNLEGYSTMKLRVYYYFVGNQGDFAKIKIHSGDEAQVTYVLDSVSGILHKEFSITNFPDKTDIYINFSYKEGVNGGSSSFNIDKVTFWPKAGGIILDYGFEDPWVDDGDGDLAPEGWRQEKYNQKEGVWTREQYHTDIDLDPEVYVGRAPVKSSKEASNFVFKTMKYENEEEIKNNDPFFDKVLLIGGKLADVKVDQKGWGKDFCIKMAGNIDNMDFPDKRYLCDKDIPIIRYFNRRQLRRRLNSNYHLIYDENHGTKDFIYRNKYEGGFMGEWYVNIFRFHSYDTYLLGNDKPFFICANDCLLGAFDNIDCLAEFLTVKTKHGAFAAILNAREGLVTYQTTGGPTFELYEAFYKKLCDDEYDDWELGKIHHENNYDFNRKVKDEIITNCPIRLAVFERNLFGDPTVRIRRCTDDNDVPCKPSDVGYETFNNIGDLYKYTFITSSNDPENDKISYKWKWDDHECLFWSKYYDSGDNVSKTLWLPPGAHNISVKVRDVFLNESDWSNNLTITVPFNSNIQTASTTAVLGKEIQFTGLTSGGTPPYGSWYYDFGDGNNSQQQNTTHTYNTLGSYNVTLNVTDSQNISSNYTIVINTVILNSDFESAPGPAVTNLQETFYFNDKSKGYYEIVNWSWDFGDGNTSYQRNTSHTYTSYGAYNVSLNVTDNQSNTDNFYQMMYIDPVSPTITSVSSNFNVVGYGSNVTILVNTSDSSCGIKIVKINITYPNSSYANYTMNNKANSIYEYVFSDCWQFGEYSYTVWVVDNANNTNYESEKNFVVSRMYGNSKIGGSNQTIWDTITGSVFRVNEKSVADNISVYLDPGNATSDYHYRCVIYNHNGSELVGISEEKNISVVKGWQTFNFSVPKPVLLNDTDYVIGCWSNYSNITMYYDNGTGSEEYFDDGNCTLQGHYFEGVYNYSPDPICFDHEDRKYSIYCYYTPDNTKPKITNVSNSPGTVGFGFNVTISADVSDNQSGVETVKVNITYPNSTQYSYNMDHVGNHTYEYVFSNSWLKGQYNYSIWAVDYMNHSNSSSGYSFNISAQATISVCTIKDEYGNNETVNLTDPPPGSPGVDYEFLDNGDVLHIWNRFDSYYFNTSSGIQLTNHYNEYWSHNVLMLGYYNYNGWNLIYRTDELSGFNKNIDTDNETYVNATIWKDLSYNGYDFRLAIRYYLGVDDNELTVIPYIKNIDNKDIPYVLGFGWEMKDIQIGMTTGGDYIDVNRTSYYLDQPLDNVYTDLSETEFYLMENITSTSTKSLYLKWNQSLTYKLQVKSREGQYNAPVTLFVRIGTLNKGQEKYTRMYWYDAEQVSYYFNNYSTSEAWATTPSYMVDGSISNYASTTSNDDIELCDGNNCSGADRGTISKVELRVCSYYTLCFSVTFLRPVFGGTSDGINIDYQTPPYPDIWSPWFDITNDPSAPQSWTWNDVENLDCKVVEGGGIPGFNLYCSGLEVRVTYAPAYPPEISAPYPANDSTGVSISPVLNITVSDTNGDNMNITWLSNSSGSWQPFGTNNSVCNGTYHQTMSNASVNGQWWYWKVNVTDGTDSVESSVFGFYTGCQSKIVNTGSTNIKGYLLIQIQFYNETSESWVVADDTINESSPRTILWEDPAGEPDQHVLGLDTVFNGLVNTSNLSEFGSGTYRIYAAFRDPNSDVLVCDDETLMEDTYEFTLTDT